MIKGITEIKRINNSNQSELLPGVAPDSLALAVAAAGAELL
jgi:hypothetical protein